MLNKGMTGRGRILAALARQPVDKIPFVPLLDQYALMDMPPEIMGNDPVKTYSPRKVVSAGRALGCDLMIRHVAVNGRSAGENAVHLQMLGEFKPPVETRMELSGYRLIETMSTPVGALTGEWSYTDRVGAIPHATKHVVNTLEELKIFQYAVSHLKTDPPEPRYDFFKALDREIGEDGIATTSLSNSPLMYLIEMVWGLENTYYLLNDYPDIVEDILHKLHQSLKRQAAALSESPAKVVIQYENTSSTLMSPKIFRQYVLPFLNEYADILSSAGKIYLIHMCGRLNAFREDIQKGEYDGIIDIPPPPTGDLPLDAAAEAMPEKVVIGGIDPTTFLNPDSKAVEAEISGLIQRIKPFRGVMLGSADVVPRGARVENFRLIRGLVDQSAANG